MVIFCPNGGISVTARSCAAALQEVESGGLCESLGAAVDVELTVDIASVDFDRAN